MQRNQVPLKTAKGLQEIEQRAHGLPVERRQLLIMVNGRSTVAELAAKLMKFGEIEPMLAQLEADGFIAPDPKFAPAPEKPQKPAAASAGSGQPHRFEAFDPSEFNLESAKGFVRFILLGTLGPTAERRINRIEATTTVEELRLELDGVRDMLPKVLSRQEAQRAWRQLEPLMVSIGAPPA